MRRLQHAVALTIDNRAFLLRMRAPQQKNYSLAMLID